MTPGTHRFVVLDALRGLCAIFVCLFHFHCSSPLVASPFVRASWQFVDFFFVLSGFVIAANYRTRLAAGLSPWRFLGLRLGRIYPLHVFVLALFVATELVALAVPHFHAPRSLFDAGHAPVAIPLHLLLLHSIGLLPQLTWNDASWSIATEFWAYVAFALVVPLARRRLDLLLVAVAVACPLVLRFVTPWGINVTWDWGLVRCIYGFALGVLCWTVWPRLAERTGDDARGWTIVEAVAVAAVVAFVIATRDSQWNLLGPPLFAAAVLVFAREGGALSRALSVRPLLFLGTLSYSVYMMHSFVQARVIDTLKLIEHASGIALTSTVYRGTLPVTLAGATPAQGTALVVAMLAAVVAVSYCTYRCVELPAREWSRRQLARVRPVAAVPPLR